MNAVRHLPSLLPMGHEPCVQAGRNQCIGSGQAKAPTLQAFLDRNPEASTVRRAWQRPS